MPAKEIRTLLKVGNKRKSSAITLPHGWVEYWNLKKGAELLVFYDGALVVIPKDKEDRFKTNVCKFIEG